MAAVRLMGWARWAMRLCRLAAWLLQHDAEMGSHPPPTMPRGSSSAAANRAAAGKPVDCCTANTTSWMKRKGGRASSSAVSRGLPPGSSGDSAAAVASQPTGGAAMVGACCPAALLLGFGRLFAAEERGSTVGGAGGAGVWGAGGAEALAAARRSWQSTDRQREAANSLGQGLSAQHSRLMRCQAACCRLPGAIVHIGRFCTPLTDRSEAPPPAQAHQQSLAAWLSSSGGMAFSFGATPAASVSALLRDSPLHSLSSAPRAAAGCQEGVGNAA